MCSAHGLLLDLAVGLGRTVPYFGLLDTARERLAAQFKFVDAMLPQFIQAIRDSGDSSIQVLADNLQLYHKRETSPGKATQELAEEIIKQDPHNIYAYLLAASQRTPEHRLHDIGFIASTGADTAKRHGEDNCYLLRKLLLEVAETLFYIAKAALLIGAPEDQNAREHANAALKDVLTVVEDYLKYTPPDAVDIPRMLELRMVALIMLEGPQLSLDLAELEVRCPALRTNFRRPMLTA